MKSKIGYSLLIVALFLTACAGVEEKKAERPAIEESADVQAEASLNIDSLVESIDGYRNSLEEDLPTAIELKTDSLRAKIKQKWEKIHFYADQGGLQRIKTYPYPEISKRTEEFYVKDDELVLVVIEDQGGPERGKEKSSIDKMYYFHDGEMIHELKRDQESEYGIRKGDGLELLTEFKEYQTLFQNLNE